jgi:membrane-associated phospholipid phosphatase
VAMLRDCFPSGHTGLTLLVLTRALTKKAYTFFWIMLPFALLLFVSTVYCRFHYVTDLLAAFPFVAGVLIVDAFCRRALPRGVTLAWPTIQLAKKSPA